MGDFGGRKGKRGRCNYGIISGNKANRACCKCHESRRIRLWLHIPLLLLIHLFISKKIMDGTWEMAPWLRVIVVQAQGSEYSSHHWPENLDVTSILQTAALWAGRNHCISGAYRLEILGNTNQIFGYPCTRFSEKPYFKRIRQRNRVGYQTSSSGLCKHAHIHTTCSCTHKTLTSQAHNYTHKAKGIIHFHLDLNMRCSHRFTG